MFRKLLLFFFLTFSLTAIAQISKENIIKKALDEFKLDNELKNASIGFLAIDTKTGETIAELNPDLSLMPASTLKLITTAAAYEILGKNFRYKTVLQYSGTIDTIKRVLNGDIYIKGGADPTLGSEHYDKNRSYFFIKNWISVLKNNRIDSINGRIIADASVYGTEITPPSWMWEEVANYFGTGANGLSAFDNLYRIHFISSSKPGSLTTISKIDPEIPGLMIYNEVVSSDTDSDEAFVFGSPYSYLHIIRGTIPKGKQDFVIRGAIPDPAFYLAWYFDNELRKQGIGIKMQPTTDRLLRYSGDTMTQKRMDIDVVYSPVLSSIIDLINKKSINLFAEHLFNEIGYRMKRDGSNAVGIKEITDFWVSKGMDSCGFYIADGSGLSRYNAISARHLVFVLNYMKNKSPNFNEFFRSLPVAGVSGTLRYIGQNTSAKGVVSAKSGSIGRVRAYAGYAKTKSGRELAFSMNISNYNCNSPSAREKLTKLMVAMADLNL
jgi:serine-type D-Ala-D-Ala carboxypeptidase/endopeptidase (penicillin-binding protein 4)